MFLECKLLDGCFCPPDCVWLALLSPCMNDCWIDGVFARRFVFLVPANGGVWTPGREQREG